MVNVNSWKLELHHNLPEVFSFSAWVVPASPLLGRVRDSQSGADCHVMQTEPLLYSRLLSWLRRRRVRSNQDQYPLEEHSSLRHRVRQTSVCQTRGEAVRRREEAREARHKTSQESEDCDNVFSDNSNSLTGSDTQEMVNNILGDFRIKYCELKFCDRIRSSQDTMIHHGKWHGEVVIHSSRPENDEEVEEWLREVRSLAYIRHENIVLYMGACVEPPRFAIITSPVMADDLYTNLVTNRLNNYDKLCILRQTVNAFSYLHSKNIVHGRLSSQNIFLERKVLVSLLDYAPNLPNLQYYAPEIAVQILAGHKPNSVKTKEGDIFSFGTLMYQLASGRLPFDTLTVGSLQTKVTCGEQAEILHTESVNSNLCILIRKCWLNQPAERPSFLGLSRLFQPRNWISKKLSSSEPKNMDKITRTGLLT